MKRLTHVDTMKAIGIVLVVVGHAPGLDATLKQVIYAFHMPLFFFISGLLLSESKLFMPGRAYFFSVWKGLGIPYLFFFLVSYLYWLPTHEMASRASQYAGIRWWEPLIGVVVGNGDALYVNVVLWFFTCLITTALLFYWLRRYLSATFLLLTLNTIGLLFVLGYERGWPRLPWGLDNAVVALAFYATGHFLRRYQEALCARTTTTRARAWAALLLTAVVVIARVNGEVDLNTLHFGRYPALFIAGGYLGTLALFYLAISLPALSVFQWLSRTTLIIFPTHLLMFSAFTGVAVLVFGLPHQFKESSAVWTLAFPVMALLLSYPVSIAAPRLFPVVFGAGSRRLALQEKTS
ncbi:MAG: acyltransferase family protein [Gammaproteobacteria bacterium]